MRALLTVWTIFGSMLSFSQTLVSDFSSPVASCSKENIQLINQSVNATRYEWDVCQGDLALTPTGSIISNLTGSSIPLGIDVVFDGTTWFGFVTSRNSNSIYRFTFDPSFESITSVVNLGNVGSMLTQPVEIKIVTDNGKWYGFISNQSGSVSTSLITRIDFGTSLTNALPTATSIIDGVTFAGDAGLDIVQSNAEWMLLYNQIAPGPAYQTAIARLTTIESIPDTADRLTIAYSGTPSIHDVKIIKNGTGYHAYVVADSPSKLFHIDFGSDIFTTPSPTDVSSVLPANLSLYGVDGDFDNGNFYLFLSSDQGSIVRVDLGNDLMQNPLSAENIGTLGIFTNNRKLRLVKEKTQWHAFSIDWSSGNIFRASFPMPSCAITPGFFTTTDLSIQYTASGNKYVSLRSFQNGKYADQHKGISVSTLQAPTLDFISNGICKQTPITFTLQSDQPITDSNWDFGDGNMSTVAAPVNTFAAIGSYKITLTVQSQNGCKNQKGRSVSIYDQPVTNFAPPTGLICTNNEFTFTNTTTDNFDGNLSYQWLVDNVPQSTSRDLKYAFQSGGNKEVKLITSIPGCADESAQVINNVLPGPTVGFTIDGRCEASMVNFTNTSSGDITGYVWDSGDGQTSTATNFSNTYPTKGNYNVSLKTTASNSCVSTKTQPLTIYSKPQPNFSLDLPPFSCSGTPSQFNDLTPGPSDSNLSSWAWNFGDAGTSTDRNPLHTFTNAGDYNVSLTATTNFGCSASFQKSVNIAASPPADFTYTPACINQGTRFTDASGSGVKSWFWTIGSSTYAFSNPTHVFSGSGSFSAKLTVTGNNNCVATVTKTINVPVVPSLSFSVDNACEKQAANFKDTSPANTDPAVSWAWDFAGQGTATGNATQYSFAKAGSYAVKMTSTQQSGCVYSLSKNVTINTTPVAAFTSSPEWGVPPLTVQFTNTSTGANSYLWHFNDKNNSTSTLTSPGFVFTDLGDYVVDLLATSALGCSGSASGKISVIIPSLDLELKQLQLVKDPTSNVYRIFVTVKNKSNYLLTSVDVVVDISGNALIKETINTNLLPDAEIVQLLNNQILPHGNSLTYLCASIEVDNDNDPFNNSKCESLEEETIVFDPYPNPSNGTFNFQWIASTTDNAHFEIFNAMGQLSFEQDAESVQVGLNQMQFDLSNLNTGAYYFRFSSNSVSKTLPIQIVR